ncbi:hypothetical protein [Haliangium sp.]|uniref:hypothetical protein n=1 Tax=Haliangium sp. TaxID=2663208 RepID=UPI003D149B55
MKTKHALTSLSLLALVCVTLSACYGGDEFEYASEAEAPVAEEQADLDYVAAILQEMLEDGSAESFPHPDELQLATDEAVTLATFTIEEVRLRHASTGKCIYGTSPENGTVHNWVCWNDPGMTYKVYTHILSNTKFLVHKQTNKYIEAHPTNGATVTNRSGYNPYMPLRFNFDDAGGGKVRIRNSYTGKCLYGTNTDGGTVHNWDCWNDPGMAFYIDPV